jgi:hypothetical protein
MASVLIMDGDEKDPHGGGCTHCTLLESGHRFPSPARDQCTNTAAAESPRTPLASGPEWLLPPFLFTGLLWVLHRCLRSHLSSPGKSQAGLALPANGRTGRLTLFCQDQPQPAGCCQFLVDDSTVVGSGGPMEAQGSRKCQHKANRMKLQAGRTVICPSPIFFFPTRSLDRLHVLS